MNTVGDDGLFSARFNVAGEAGDFDLLLGVGDHTQQVGGIAVQAVKVKHLVIAHPDGARADGGSGGALIPLILNDDAQSNAFGRGVENAAVSDGNHPIKFHRQSTFRQKLLRNPNAELRSGRKQPMTQNLKDTSKFLSFILRHKPDAIGLTLDPEGWADIEDLIAKADIPISQDLLREVVSTSDKKRFDISADGLSIRANQGHSIAVDLGLEPVEPPEFLYHGTATRFLASIKQEGLRPQNRQYVHLSADHDTAVSVGQRHGKPTILTIPALQMHQQGHKFFQAANGVWLTKSVPADTLQVTRSFSKSSDQ